MAWGLERLAWPERREKVGRFLFVKDQRLCLGAGLLAEHLLRRAGATDLTIGYGEHGKPYLVNHPSIHFNLSHSGSLAVCAVADVPVGVDVETIHDHGDAVAQYCFQPAELEWLDRAPDRALAFTRLWVRKESYIKLTGTGLSREPRTLSVLPGEPVENGAKLKEYAVRDTLLCVCTNVSREVRLTKWSLSGPR